MTGVQILETRRDPGDSVKVQWEQMQHFPQKQGTDGRSSQVPICQRLYSGKQQEERELHV